MSHLSMTVYVDDNGLIGPVEIEVNKEMRALQDWAGETAGVPFKRIKDAPASQRPLYIGFWCVPPRTPPDLTLLQRAGATGVYPEPEGFGFCPK